MKAPVWNTQRTAYLLITLTLGTYLLIVGKFILVPLTFAAILAVMLQPLCAFYDRLIPFKSISILLAMLTILIPIAGIISFFSIQLTEVFRNLTSITSNLKGSFDEIFQWLNDNFGVTKADSYDWLKANFAKVVDAPLEFFKGGINTSTTAILNLFLVLLFLFFFLLYRQGFHNFLLMQMKPSYRNKGQELMHQIQWLIRHYLYGLFTVILILATLNSFGLWAIGLKHPIFWAVMAAFLSIIPYIGTTIGGLLPFLYAVATASAWWQPLAVVGLYFTVQQIEGNFITPYVVGSSVRINPFVAIVSIFVAGAIWGIAGIVLALPITAIMKVILDNIDMLKPLGLLMSDRLHKEGDRFLDELDEDRYRLSRFFKNEKDD